MKTVLCIDTISSAAGITLVKEELTIHVPLNPMMASEGILPLIDEVIQKGSIQLHELDEVAVIKGPGSFTGLRVGISVANQFAHQLKIPILGLRTDEWWLLRSSLPNRIYLQSMNKEEVYVSDEQGQRIIALETLKELGKKQWLGDLKFDHTDKLPSSFSAIAELDSKEHTWETIAKESFTALAQSQLYELIEPFYGKEPKITPKKNKN